LNLETIQTVAFTIKGMSCSGCEEEVKHELNKLNGIVKAEVSYANKNAIIQFDHSKTNIPTIENAINATGYTVIKTTIK
jgi:copper chaperone CopZ